MIKGFSHNKDVYKNNTNQSLEKLISNENGSSSKKEVSFLLEKIADRPQYSQHLDKSYQQPDSTDESVGAQISFQIKDELLKENNIPHKQISKKLILSERSKSSFQQKFNEVAKLYQDFLLNMTNGAGKEHDEAHNNKKQRKIKSKISAGLQYFNPFLLSPYLEHKRNNNHSRIWFESPQSTSDFRQAKDSDNQMSIKKEYSHNLAFNPDSETDLTQRRVKSQNSRPYIVGTIKQKEGPKNPYLTILEPEESFDKNGEQDKVNSTVNLKKKVLDDVSKGNMIIPIVEKLNNKRTNEQSIQALTPLKLPRIILNKVNEPIRAKSLSKRTNSKFSSPFSRLATEEPVHGKKGYSNNSSWLDETLVNKKGKLINDKFLKFLESFSYKNEKDTISTEILEQNSENEKGQKEERDIEIGRNLLLKMESINEDQSVKISSSIINRNIRKQKLPENQEKPQLFSLPDVSNRSYSQDRKHYHFEIKPPQILTGNSLLNNVNASNQNKKKSNENKNDKTGWQKDNAEKLDIEAKIAKLAEKRYQEKKLKPDQRYDKLINTSIEEKFNEIYRALRLKNKTKRVQFSSDVNN